MADAPWRKSAVETVEPLSLNLRHLRALAAIARVGSMGGAAKAANLSQPALAQGLARIERQVGVRLFERSTAGMSVTDHGGILVRRIDAGLARLAEFATVGKRGFGRPDMLMTGTQLRSLLALSRSSSYSEAARITAGSQPAIHRAVRDLEQICGVPLVERRARGTSLTDSGLRLARAARLLEAELSAGLEDMRPDASASGTIVVGAMPLCRARLLPAAMKAMLDDEASLVRFDIVEGSWLQLIAALRDGHIDLVVGALRGATAPPDLEEVVIHRDEMAVVARAGHPVADRTVDVAALARHPWIIGRPGSPLRAHWEKLFAGRDLPEARIECGSVMMIRGLLMQSDLLTLLSPDQVTVEVEAGLLTVLSVPGGGLERMIGVTTRSGWRPTVLQSRLIAALVGAGKAD